MQRRNSDYVCFIVGAVLLITGAFTFVFPEISYKSGTEAPLPQAVSRPGEKRIVIPKVFSAALCAIGGLLVYNFFKIRKREVTE